MSVLRMNCCPPAWTSPTFVFSVSDSYCSHLFCRWVKILICNNRFISIKLLVITILVLTTMKTLKIFLTTLIAIVFGLTTSAQTHDHMNMNMPTAKTETFKVWGKCDMCKALIEKTVKAEGATSAAWDEKTQMLTVTYDPSKINRDGLCKKLASIGYDTEKYKATDDVYGKLPNCCHYERSK